jgi:hypothetical protein
MLLKYHLITIISLMFFLFALSGGCESQKGCGTCGQTSNQGSHFIPADEQSRTALYQQNPDCPTCGKLTVYSDGSTEAENIRCDVKQKEKQIIECRPPKVTPKASACPPCSQPPAL